MTRSPHIAHWTGLQAADAFSYPGSTEQHTIGSPFARHFGFERLGIHHELLLPGRRTSWPHAESTEDEFIFVVAGTPDAWIDGHLHRLAPGDGVGFKAGDGTAHSFINNTDSPVQLLVVGDANRADNRIHYPLHPARNASVSGHWSDVPERPLGPHDGVPDAQR